jgi:hypothetical protein
VPEITFFAPAPSPSNVSVKVPLSVRPERVPVKAKRRITTPAKAGFCEEPGAPSMLNWKVT